MLSFAGACRLPRNAAYGLGKPYSYSLGVNAMKGIGGTLLLFGAGSFVLNMIGMEFVLLSWIDMWGAGTGIAIRVAMIVVGILLLIVGAGVEGNE